MKFKKIVEKMKFIKGGKETLINTFFGCLYTNW